MDEVGHDDDNNNHNNNNINNKGDIKLEEKTNEKSTNQNFSS